MISKHVNCRAANDNYGRLANYIADASHQGEKSLVSWCAGCWAGDDYDLGIKEVASTQALNTRSHGSKTYHLVISFRPEDEVKLKEEDFRAIEERFAHALGLSGHQRHCGVHVNTENMHMHVAYNLIHPENLRRIEPWRDYIKRDRLCRELEREYGLVIDNGRPAERTHGLGEKSATLEAHTGQQSFERYCQELADKLGAELNVARSWEDVHKLFASRGLILKPRGAGLIIANRHGHQMTKASSMHRDISLKKLVDRFGAFKFPETELPESQLRYSPRPIQKLRERNELWETFQQEHQAQKELLQNIRKKWQEKRTDLMRQPLGRRSRGRLLKLFRQYETQQVHEARKDRPANWLDFLRQKAGEGNENALAMLRSRHEEMAPDQSLQQDQQRQSQYLASRTAILENRELGPKAKTRLLGIALMEKIAEGSTAKISKHGCVIHTLANGGKICDTGRRISFSENARETALSYMAAKWGVRARSFDRTGEPIYILANGQKVVDRKGSNVFERPQEARLQGRERGKGRDI